MRRWRGTELLEIVRDLEAEGSAMQKLTRHGLRPAGDLPWPLRDTVTDLKDAEDLRQWLSRSSTNSP